MKRSIWLRQVCISLSMLLIFGCTSVDKPSLLQKQDANGESGLVYVYRLRTGYLRFDPDVPILYVDGERQGRMKIGRHTSFVLSAGKHTVSIKNSMLGLPTWEAGSVKLDLAPSGVVYLQYSKELQSMSFVSGVAVAESNSELVPVDEPTGQKGVAETRFARMQQ